ncbi:astacin [Ostertagia ostertagi]
MAVCVDTDVSDLKKSKTLNVSNVSKAWKELGPKKAGKLLSRIKEVGDQQVDIMKDSASRTKRQAPNDKTYPGKRWPYVVNYTLDNGLDNKTKEAFKNATYLWMNDTCIDFMEDLAEESEDMILVYKHDGCWAEVGRHGGWQLISLGEDCNTVPNLRSFTSMSWCPLSFSEFTRKQTQQFPEFF